MACSIYKKKEKLEQEMKDLWKQMLEYKDVSMPRFKEICETYRRKKTELDKLKTEYGI